MPFLVKYQCLFIGEEWKSFEGEIWSWVGEWVRWSITDLKAAELLRWWWWWWCCPLKRFFPKLVEKVEPAQKWDFSKHLTSVCSCQQTLFRAPASAVSKLTECMCGNVKLANSCGCAIHLSKWAIHLLIMATCLWVIKMITMVLSGRARWWLEWWPRADADARWPSIHIRAISQTLLNPLRRIWSGSAFVNNPASGATPLAAQDNGY